MVKTTDFSEILSQLNEWGFSDYKLADETGIERSKLSKLRTGEQKRAYYDDGLAIMVVYNKEKKRKH